MGWTCYNTDNQSQVEVSVIVDWVIFYHLTIRPLISFR
jgi:hypothetical protein